MRILALTPDAPSKTHLNGGTTRQFEILRRLIELGHEVTVVGPFPAVEHDQIGELEAEGFKVYPVRRPASRMREVLSAALRQPTILLQAFARPTSAVISSIYRVRIAPIVKDLLATEEFDIVSVEREMAADWIELVPGLPAVLSFQHLESAYHRERARRMSGPAAWWVRMQVRRCRRHERKWTPHYRSVICMSESELGQLREVVPNLPPAIAIGNGSDITAFEAVGPDPAGQHVLFTGTMNFEPNVVASEWLVREVWPHVRSRMPNVRLDIVGRDPTDATMALGEVEGVTVHGGVPSMLPYYEAASVCLLPMREGGGTRLKLADAFAARRAVVATINGASGVDVVDGRDLLIGDSAEDFADAVCRLLDDDELRAQIAAAGRRFAESELNWSVLGERAADWFSRTLSRR